jgi:hypothetical protein
MELTEIKKIAKRIRATQLEVKELEAKIGKDKAELLAEFKIGDKSVFTLKDPELGEGQFTLCRVEAKERRIAWKEVALKLARQLYPTKDTMRKWLRLLIKANPKKAKKPFLFFRVDKIKD